MICRKYMVSGRVQGVFYRATVAQFARELQIRGHARNMPDGRVEVLACGEQHALATFIHRLWSGSSASRVTAVEVTELQAGAVSVPDSFHTF